MRKLFTNTNIDFVGSRKIAYLITAVFFALGLVVTLIRPQNQSVEFTGGTFMHIRSSNSVDVAKIRAALDAEGIKGAEITRYGDSTEYKITARSAKEGADANNTDLTAAAVKVALQKVRGSTAGTDSVLEKAAVGPKVGAELRGKAIRAILLAFALVLAYLAYRFEWRFGAAAVTATAHDVIGTVFFISICHFEISLVLVGAVLSVLGLSMNETIIIFDRVRENEKRKVPGDLKTVLNLSINETLPRTVLTHGTSLATMLTLVIFGGEVIRPFALVMFWGVFTGLFSSMFIAPSILLYIRSRWPLKLVPTAAPRRPAMPKRTAAV